MVWSNKVGVASSKGVGLGLQEGVEQPGGCGFNYTGGGG